MTGRPQRFELHLSPEECGVLRRVMQDPASTPRQRSRAKVLLMRFEGRTYAEIEAEAGVSTPTIAKILKKGVVYGALAALNDLHHAGRGEVIGAGARAWVISLACQFPEDVPDAPRQPRWTVSSLSDYVRGHAEGAGYPELCAVQTSTVWNILSDPSAKPSRLLYCLENRDEPDPGTGSQVLLLYRRMEFVPVRADDDRGRGWCAQEPAGAAYSAVMQAVAASALIEPAPPPPRRPGDEHFSVLTGVDMQTGYVFHLVRQDYTGDAFIEFLRQADRHYPQRRDIVLVLEKCWVYRTREVLDYLAGCRRGRFRFVCEHQNPYWLNLVECFLTKLVRQTFGEIRAESRKDLAREISRRLIEINREPVAFRWPGSADEIARILRIEE